MSLAICGALTTELSAGCAECLSESATCITTTVMPSSAGSRFVAIGAVVRSEQERIVARTKAPAKPALRGLKRPENRVERRIVTLIERVTYKTTTRLKLNSSYGHLGGINPFSQTYFERQFCDGTSTLQSFSPPIKTAMIAFWICRRFSASSQTLLCGPSMTSAATSSPR